MNQSEKLWMDIENILSVASDLVDKLTKGGAVTWVNPEFTPW